MSKEKVRHLTGVMASIFSHIGHISKEEAKEISGLTGKEFDAAYSKAAGFADKIIKTEGDKADAFMDHLAKEIDEYFRHCGGKICE
jgi:enoyl-CoA hydratase/carnithine racemase